MINGINLEKVTKVVALPDIKSIGRVGDFIEQLQKQSKKYRDPKLVIMRDEKEQDINIYMYEGHLDLNLPIPDFMKDELHGFKRD